MTAAQIAREARRFGLDPVEHALDLADGFGWDEDMTATAVAAVEALAELSALVTVEPHHWANGVPARCDTCDTLARRHGVTYVVVGHGEFCSRRCFEAWAA